MPIEATLRNATCEVAEPEIPIADQAGPESLLKKMTSRIHFRLPPLLKKADKNNDRGEG